LLIYLSHSSGIPQVRVRTLPAILSYKIEWDKCQRKKEWESSWNKTAILQSKNQLLYKRFWKVWY